MKIQVPLSPWPPAGVEIVDENVGITPVQEKFTSPQKLKKSENYKEKDTGRVEDHGVFRTPLADLRNGIPTVLAVQTKPEPTKVHLVVKIIDRNKQKYDDERSLHLGRITELQEALQATRQELDRFVSESNSVKEFTTQQPIALHINIVEVQNQQVNSVKEDDYETSKHWERACNVLEKKLEASELVNSILSRRILWLQRASQHQCWENDRRNEFLSFESAVKEACNTRHVEAESIKEIEEENDRLQSEMLEMEEKMDRLRTENRSLSRQLHYISNVLGSHAALVEDVAPSLVRLARELVSFCEKHQQSQQSCVGMDRQRGGTVSNSKTPMTSFKKTLKRNYAPQRV